MYFKKCAALVGLLLMSFTSIAKEERAQLHLGARVSGKIVADLILPENDRSQTMGLHDLEVLLFDLKSGEKARQSLTSIDGGFEFNALNPGVYQLCWQNKYLGEECHQEFEVKNENVDYKKLLISKEPLVAEKIFDREYLLELIARFRLATPSYECKDNLGVVNSTRYLSRKQNSFDVQRQQAVGEAYYNKIDPNRKRTTLGDWWQTNGFDPLTGRAPAENNGYKAAAVAYLNHNDLGFGRNMHCLRKNANAIACWVANHGQGDQKLSNADAAAAYDAPGPTVTMEFSAIDTFTRVVFPDWYLPSNLEELKLEGEELQQAKIELEKLAYLNPRHTIPEVIYDFFLKPTVKFYVYAPSNSTQEHADFPRTTVADLDGCGDKHQPGLCLNCHGGDVPSDIMSGARTVWTNQDVRLVGKASFREFDTASFKYPGGRDQPNRVEHAMFHRLNKLVLDTDPSDGIEGLINGWYANPPANSDINAIDENYVPQSWSAEPQAYKDGIAKACRTCHIALDPEYDWDNKANFDHEFSNSQDLQNLICNANNSMPHAKITNKNFTLVEKNAILSAVGLSCP